MVKIGVILEIIDVCKKYNAHSLQIEALTGVNINLEEGELLCILGPSGCGKSTLLRCIAGFESVSGGKILLDRHPVTKPGPDRTMVFQGFDQLLPWKTVLENVEFPLKINGVGTKKMPRETALEFVSMVGLSGFINNYPHELSGGMKQRVAIARALALRPRVLLMDEPFASLDAQTRTALQSELIKIWEKSGITIVFITHNIQEAIILGSRIGVMSKSPGTIKRILDNRLGRPRFVGYPGFDEMWQELHALLGFNRV